MICSISISFWWFGPILISWPHSEPALYVGLSHDDADVWSFAAVIYWAIRAYSYTSKNKSYIEVTQAQGK